MRLLSMLEIVESKFPLPRLRVIFDLNEALRNFCYRTRVLSYRHKMVVATTKTAEDTTLAITTFTLPSDFSELIAIDELTMENLRIAAGALEVFSFDSALTYFWLYYSAQPSLMANDGDVPGIRQEWHRAVVSKVLADYYADAGNVDQARFYLAQYEQAVREAIRFVNTARTHTMSTNSGGSTVQHAYAEGVTLAAGPNTISIVAQGVTFADLQYVINMEGGGAIVSEVNPDTELKDGRTTTSFKVWASTATSNFSWLAVGA